MKVKIIQAGGMFAINYSYNGIRESIGSTLSINLEMDGTETITFRDRLLQSCEVDLKEYDRDIIIFVFSTSEIVRGTVKAIVVDKNAYMDFKYIY